MMGVLRCVIFSPEDLALIREGPSVRRRFLDMMISQVSRPYFIALQQYRTALSQRNAILRQARAENRMPDGMIRDFEDAMADRAEVICRERIRYTEMLSEYADGVYRRVSGRDGEEFRIQYHPSVQWDGAGEFPLRKMLEEDRPEDVKQGNTSRGPQRDDLVPTLNQKNMKLYASQGQIRTGALSLKLGQLKLMERISGDAPVLLLDDVMSELDRDRRTRLVKEISDYQTFITCTDESDLELEGSRRTYHVSAPEGNAVLEETNRGEMREALPLTEPDFT
jgi:DNA replication and repair protein RecF